MFDQDLLVHAWKDMAWYNNLRIAISRKTERPDKIEVAKFEFAELDIGCEYPPDSMLTIPNKAAQILMDDLWKCGIRPTEGAGTAGSMAAAQKHLADMRAIVSKKLGIALP